MPVLTEPAPRFALRGQVVTMVAGAKPLRDGVVYVDGGRIADVRPASQPPPDGFVGVTPINTGARSTPGLIELHNHLSYDVIPLWRVPMTVRQPRPVAGRDDYRKLVTGPMSVLASHRRLHRGHRPLRGGQVPRGRHHHVAGHHPPDQRPHPPPLPGVVRNVEQPGDPRPPRAPTPRSPTSTRAPPRPS